MIFSLKAVCELMSTDSYQWVSSSS